MDTVPTLAGRWQALAQHLGAREGAAADAWRLLLLRYGEPHRSYHNLAHVAAVLDGIDTLVAAGEPVADPVAVRLAAWFHDVVYALQGTGNEQASARLAEVVMTDLGVDAARLGRVADLILTTADHVATDADAAVLVDADLTVLAGAPAEYRCYVTAVRREYAGVSDEAWRVGRGAVLQGLLDRNPLFATPTMQRRHREARRNLTDELTHLRDG